MKLFKKTFRFTGGEIVGEFLMSLGYLPGAHAPGCPVAKKIARLGPPWAKAEKRAKAKSPPSADAPWGRHNSERGSAPDPHGQGPDPRLKSRSLDPKEMNDLCASPPISCRR